MPGDSSPLRALFLGLLLLIGSVPHASAQVSPVPSSLLYQGRLAKPDGTPVAAGLYNLRFSLWTSPLGGTQTWSQASDNVPVKNGVFAVSFSGITAQTFAQASYLEIQIGSTTLGRRQRLLTVASAFKAESVADGAVQFRSIVDGAITLPKLAPDAIDTTRWLLGGNAASPGAFLGTTNDRPLTLQVRNRPAARYDYAESTNLGYRGVNILGGAEINLVDTGMVGATITGGGRDTFDGIDSFNGIYGYFGAIGGGLSQRITGYAGAVMGGQRNDARTESAAAGGSDNWARGQYASVGGGAANVATGLYGAVPGGLYARAAGDFAFGGGAVALASADGAFVWADPGNNADFVNSVTDQFAVRATGGVRIVTGADAQGGATAAITLAAGDSSWVSHSDRNAKTAFAPLNGSDFLERYLGLPLSSWRYKTRKDIRHMGPMAQDFYAAFRLGTDDRHISMVDADGAALAALQELSHRLEAKRQRLAALEIENAALQERLRALTAAIERMAAQPSPK